MRFDLIAQGEIGAGIAGLGLVELVAEGGEGLGAPGRGERVEPDEQLAGSGDDVAGCGEGLADQHHAAAGALILTLGLFCFVLECACVNVDLGRCLRVVFLLCVVFLLGLA
jgi:hypothetical protein